MKLKVVLEPSDEGGYTVFVPALPGCISEGESIDDALANIREAIELYLEPVEDRHDLSVVAQRSEEKTISLTEMRGRLAEDGLLAGVSAP